LLPEYEIKKLGSVILTLNQNLGIRFVSPFFAAMCVINQNIMVSRSFHFLSISCILLLFFGCVEETSKPRKTDVLGSGFPLTTNRTWIYAQTIDRGNSSGPISTENSQLEVKVIGDKVVNNLDCKEIRFVRIQSGIRTYQFTGFYSTADRSLKLVGVSTGKVKSENQLRDIFDVGYATGLLGIGPSQSQDGSKVDSIFIYNVPVFLIRDEVLDQTFWIQEEFLEFISAYETEMLRGKSWALKSRFERHPIGNFYVRNLVSMRVRSGYSYALSDYSENWSSGQDGLFTYYSGGLLYSESRIEREVSFSDTYTNTKLNLIRVEN
jgi:hypothetical protein